uniref:Uncharacterized protein n=1 Tax=Myotis myotis TaxID=51298 RepID=A0A7J7XHK8_MYOMY|nr:hypothetical protein mMyoMyo1_011739 [Myotis myotis]
MGSHPKSQDRGSRSPPAPSARRGAAAADAWGTPPSRVGGKQGGLTSAVSAGSLRGLSRLRADKGEPCAAAARHPRSSQPVRGLSEHPRKMRAGADSASKQGHPERRGGRGGRFCPGARAVCS